jgi:F-type H+-transporting ATPase subunit gamma
MDRAAAATAYTDRMTQLVQDVMASGVEVKHPLLEGREHVNHATLLVLTGNRGFCGGFNGNVVRAAANRLLELKALAPNCRLEVSGKKGISAFKFRGSPPDVAFSHFDDKPAFDEVDVIATRYLDEYAIGKLDRLDVAYTKFESIARQRVVIETLLPLSDISSGPSKKAATTDTGRYLPIYEFRPSPADILAEIVPTSFKIKLFKCFLDSAVSEQIARMVAMKSATENADDMIKQLSRQYNRARQSRITSELMDVIGGVEALS